MLRVLDAKGGKSHIFSEIPVAKRKTGSIALVSSGAGKRESRIEFQNHSEEGPGVFFLLLTPVQSCAGQKFRAQKFWLTPLSWREQN